MKLAVLKLAKDDLKEIHEYLSEFGEDPPCKFRASFEKFCAQAANMPHSYSQYEHAPNYRKAVLAFGYLVFYRAEKDKVKIYRVLHGKRSVGILL
ncbi:MAG: type II toxin-antitoxin system RelE/ParE family toxin [Synergistaceae bacterium]|nr:type II toxin-antitoxin system RelE/ParE family toxin [Synergistaceae bacterium]